MKLGFIGFGEAPHHISRDFVNSDVEVRAFDVSAKDDSPRAQKMREHAAMDQVTLVTDMAELIAWGDVFFCFTSADVALPIARQAAPLLRPGLPRRSGRSPRCSRTAGATSWRARSWPPSR